MSLINFDGGPHVYIFLHPIVLWEFFILGMYLLFQRERDATTLYLSRLEVYQTRRSEFE